MCITNPLAEDVADSATVVVVAVVTVVVAEASHPVADAVVSAATVVDVEADAVASVTAVDVEAVVVLPVAVVPPEAAAVVVPVAERTLILHISHAAKTNKPPARSLSSPIATPVSSLRAERRISSLPRT